MSRSHLGRRATLAALTIAVAGSMVACSSPAPEATTEGWVPDGRIEYVVPTSAGGGSDTMARLIAEILTDEGIVSESITVVNKSGGSGAVAMAYLDQEAGNPLALMNAATSFLTTPLLGETELTYQDFTPIALLGTDVGLLVVQEDSPYETFEDLIDAAKDDPAAITQGGGNVTTTEALVGRVLREEFDADWEYVSFDGGTEALTAVLGGHVTFSMPGPIEVSEQIRAGLLRPLATTSPERLEDFPDVPTLTELGIDSVPVTMRAIVAPGDLEPVAVAFWEDAFLQLTETDQWKAYLDESGVTPMYLNSADLLAFFEERNPIYEELMADQVP